jgi:AraC family transcriptional regulator
MQIRGFSLSEATFPSEFTVIRHAHERASICLALAGGCTEFYSAQERPFRRLSWEYLPAHEEHSIVVNREGMLSFSIEFAHDWLENLSSYAPATKESVHLTGGNIGWLLWRLHNEFRHLDEVSPLAIEGLALEVLAEISRQRAKQPETKAPKWLHTAEEIIRTEFHERLTLTHVAKEVGVHPVHLAREFRRQYKVTFGDYLRRNRIEYISHLLAKSETPLVEIAASAGFSDQSHLSRTFKRFTGMSPSRYRAACRER